MASATLDGRHRENLKKFDKKKESLPKLEKKFDRIEKKLEKLNKKKNCDCTDEEIHLKHSLKKEIKTIEKDIQNIKDNIDKSNYYLETSLLLSKYYDNKYSSKPKIQPKKSIISFFDKKTEKSFNMNDFITPVIKLCRENIEDKRALELIHILRDCENAITNYINLCELRSESFGDYADKLKSKYNQIVKNISELCNVKII